MQGPSSDGVTTF